MGGCTRLFSLRLSRQLSLVALRFPLDVSFSGLFRLPNLFQYNSIYTC
jgi:hypothetical protein